MFTGVWRDGGWRYRLSLIAVVIGVALVASLRVRVLLAGLVWQAGVTFLIAIAIVIFANYHRIQDTSAVTAAGDARTCPSSLLGSGTP